MDEDKYPTDSNRRRFVKGVVGGASLIGVGTTAAAAVNTLTASTGAGGGAVRFYAVENVDGPAPRGMPMIPVQIEEREGEEVLTGLWPRTYNEDEGVAVQREIDGVDLPVPYRSSWFQYCGVQTYPGIDPEADQDNTFRYAAESKYTWQNEQTEQGAPMRVSDFEDYEDWSNENTSSGRGKPASGTWRSEGISDGIIPVEVIRSPIIERMAKSGEAPWITAATERGFMAHLNKCSHFCCVPGFATSNYEGAVSATGNIYCQCHQSIYDPFSIVQKSYVALPRPTE